jgi:hypothetical protein
VLGSYLAALTIYRSIAGPSATVPPAAIRTLGSNIAIDAELADLLWQAAIDAASN